MPHENKELSPKALAITAGICILLAVYCMPLLVVLAIIAGLLLLFS
jgi:hypothetical protein